MNCPEQMHPACTPPPDFPQRINTLLFKRHADDWRTRIKNQILGENLKENSTGQALANLVQREQEILAKEVRWLQDIAWKVRRRAESGRNTGTKTKNSRQRISLLKAILAKAELPQPQDKIRGATRKAMRGVGFPHYLKSTIQKLVWQQSNWTSLLSEEIWKRENSCVKKI